MKFEKTYRIVYDGGQKSAWFPVGCGFEDYDDVTDVVEIPVIIADEGKTMWYGGEELGGFVVADGIDPERITEVDLPPEEPIEEEPEVDLVEEEVQCE